MDQLWPFDHAFSNPENSVADGVRLVVIAASIVMLVLVFRIARQVRASRQFVKYALVCFGASAIWTEIEALGTPATPRLLLNTAGCIFGLVYLWRSRVRGVEDEESVQPNPEGDV